MRAGILIGLIVALIAAIFLLSPRVMHEVARFAADAEFIKLFFAFAAVALVTVMIIRG